MSPAVVQMAASLRRTLVLLYRYRLVLTVPGLQRVNDYYNINTRSSALRLFCFSEKLCKKSPAAQPDDLVMRK